MRVGNTRPYPPTGLTTTQWRNIGLDLVAFDDLTTTQDGIYLHALFAPPRPESDGFPHVVEWEGTLYLEDGHTRVVREYLRGYGSTLMRVYRTSLE